VRIINRIGDSLLERLIPGVKAQAAPCPCEGGPGCYFCSFGFLCQIVDEACNHWRCYTNIHC